MSHFTKMDNVEIKDIASFIKAAKELGFTNVKRNAIMRGYQGNEMKADVVVSKSGCQYDVGLVKKKGKLELISDWWGVNQTVRDAANKFSQLTTKHTIKSKYAKLGFIAKTKVDAKTGNVILRLSR